EGINEPVRYVHGSQAGIFRILKALAPAQKQSVPLDRYEIQIDPHLPQVFLYILVHREREHLPGARGRDQRAGLDTLALIPHLLEQFCSLLGVVLIAYLGTGEPGVAGIDFSNGRSTGVIQKRFTDPLTVNGVVRRLAHELIIPWGGS